MQSPAQHRTAPTRSSRAGRPGVAALMIGGLVAGTIATAGASVLRADPEQATSSLDGAQAAPPVQAPGEPDGATSLTSFDSASLAALREQGAAGRSQARPAPTDAESTGTTLQSSPFTATTPEPAPAVVEPVPAETAPEPVVQESVVQESVVQEPAAPEPVAVQQPAAPEPVAVQEPAPEPAAQAPVAVPASTPSQPEPEAVAPAPRAGGSLMSIAASYIGAPYVLYGTPPNAFDCSAYTWFVYQQAGISIPRTVAGQRAAVTPVSNPQPGDLIVYNNHHHVGLYAGNGMTYEAIQGGVRLAPVWDSNVWYGRFN